jgi:hypothetical protein
VVAAGAAVGAVVATAAGGCVATGGVVGAGGATVVATPQADNSMLARITRLNTMLSFLFILISPPKKDLGTTGILRESIPTVIDQTLLPEESYLQM